MKYLLLSTLLFLNLPLYAVCGEDLYHGRSYNEDVQRKFNLEQATVVEVTSDIKFRPKSQDDARTYYYVMPQSHGDHLVNIKATVSTT